MTEGFAVCVIGKVTHFLIFNRKRKRNNQKHNPKPPSDIACALHRACSKGQLPDRQRLMAHMHCGFMSQRNVTRRTFCHTKKCSFMSRRRTSCRVSAEKLYMHISDIHEAPRGSDRPWPTPNEAWGPLGHLGVVAAVMASWGISPGHRSMCSCAQVSLFWLFS